MSQIQPAVAKPVRKKKTSDPDSLLQWKTTAPKKTAERLPVNTASLPSLCELPPLAEPSCRSALQQARKNKKAALSPQPETPQQPAVLKENLAAQLPDISKPKPALVQTDKPKNPLSDLARALLSCLPKRPSRPCANPSPVRKKRPRLSDGAWIRPDGTIKMVNNSYTTDTAILRSLREGIPLSVRVSGVEKLPAGEGYGAVAFAGDWKILIPAGEFMDWPTRSRKDMATLQEISLLQRLGSVVRILIKAVDQTSRTAFASRKEADEIIAETLFFSTDAQGYLLKEGQMVCADIQNVSTKGITVWAMGKEVFLGADELKAEDPKARYVPGGKVYCTIASIHRNHKRQNCTFELEVCCCDSQAHLPALSCRYHGQVTGRVRDGLNVQIGPFQVFCHDRHLTKQLALEKDVLKKHLPLLHGLIMGQKQRLSPFLFSKGKEFTTELIYKNVPQIGDKVIIKITETSGGPERLKGVILR